MSSCREWHKNGDEDFFKFHMHSCSCCHFLRSIAGEPVHLQKTLNKDCAGIVLVGRMLLCSSLKHVCGYLSIES